VVLRSAWATRLGMTVEVFGTLSECLSFGRGWLLSSSSQSAVVNTPPPHTRLTVHSFVIPELTESLLTSFLRWLFFSDRAERKGRRRRKTKRRLSGGGMMGSVREFELGRERRWEVKRRREKGGDEERGTE